MIGMHVYDNKSVCVYGDEPYRVVQGASGTFVYAGTTFENDEDPRYHSLFQLYPGCEDYCAVVTLSVAEFSTLRALDPEQLQHYLGTVLGMSRKEYEQVTAVVLSEAKPPYNTDCERFVLSLR